MNSMGDYLSSLSSPRRRGSTRDTEKILTLNTPQTMPEISRFLGIVISMYFDEHNPPHFHAKYGSHKISVEIETGIVKGTFPKRALRAVLDWYDLHKDELIKDWELAINDKPLNKIEPLE
jgi:hypothetical protein